MLLTFRNIRLARRIMVWSVVWSLVSVAGARAQDNVAGYGSSVNDTPAGQVAPAPEDAGAEVATGDGFEELMDPEEYQGFLGAQAYAEEHSTYTLGPTDVITVEVMRHPEVTGDFALNSEGKIQYAFVGDILLSGLTKEEAAEAITKRLETYIINPEVTVKIKGYNSKIVYVIGEVSRPGKIFMRGDTITVREALLDAGLPLLSAHTKKVSLFTPAADGKIDKKRVNVKALLYEGDLRQNFVMKPGDTLYLPPTFWASASRVINPVAQPIGTAAGTSRTVTGVGY